MNDRHIQILELMKAKKYLTVSALSQMLFTSESTIRRDLAQLQEKGLVLRTRGGASYVNAKALEWPLTFKAQANTEKKQIIADLALDFIQDKQTLFLDPSSTCMMLAKRLGEKKELTILTNGLMTSRLLCGHKNAAVYCACGSINAQSLSITGTDTCRYIRQFTAELAFVSCRGVHPAFGITDYIQEEAMVKQAYRKRARKLILLADSTKWGQHFFHKTFDFSQVDAIITDALPSPEMIEQLEKEGTELVCPGI
ncbi:MAG: DeoR/GlpR family DNA-binding transcription regulator [Blautia sp.]